MLLRSLAVPFVLGLSACAAPATQGTRPTEMSVARHETTAANAESVAEWTTAKNPTPAHLERAAELRRAASRHRAAARTLREAEERACIGIPEKDRDESPFEHTEDIASIVPLMGTRLPEGGLPGTLQGAVVTFRAMPGMTAQWLQRLVNCHIARNVALGHDVPEMPACPLVPKGASATVAPTSDGFAVTIRGANDASAREIWRRASALRSR